MRQLSIIVVLLVGSLAVLLPVGECHAELENVMAFTDGKISEPYGTLFRPAMTQAAQRLRPSLGMMMVKVAATFILFACWVSSCDWVNRDLYHRKAEKFWNMIMFLPFALWFGVFMVVPIFSLGFFSLLLTYVVPFAVYVSKRNGLVPDEEKVFTPRRIRFWMAPRLEKIGIKISAEGKSDEELGPPIKLTARGAATERDDNVNLLNARQSPGFLLARELLFEAFENRADSVMLDFTAAACGARFMVDGVWHQAESRERETADVMLAVLKTLANLNYNERRARQSGTFGAEYKNKKYTARITSQGTPTGERVLVQFDDGSALSKRWNDLGMRQKMQDDLKAALETRGGIAIISAPPGGGLTSLFMASVAGMDRFMNSYICVEEKSVAEMSVENVPVTTFNAAANETPMTVLPKLVREHPDGYVIPDLRDAETLTLMCDQSAEEGRTVITTARAKEASEALLRIMALKGPQAKFAKAAKLALNQRLIRRLCEHCKEAYAPPPQVLQQLGIPAGRVEALYRTPTPDPERPQPPCAHCRGVGYMGRTGIFELLMVDDGVREAMLKRPQLEVIRQMARKAGMRTLQEEGIVLVAKGVTSLPELMRVLKE